MYFKLFLWSFRYPANQGEFYKSGLAGEFDPNKANKRMRFATPQTWETQISKYANMTDN